MTSPRASAASASASAPASAAAPQFARACRNCAVAKTKCVPVAGAASSDCERCHRLRRVCVRDAPSTRKRKPPTAKTARLEQKLDELVTLLASNPPGQGQPRHAHQSSSSATPERPQYTPSTTNTLPSEPSDNAPPRPRPSSPQISGERGAFSARPVHVPCDPSELEPDDARTAECLFNYRTYMSKYFPFVIIPPDATVQTLRDTKPFLLKAIIVVASIQDLAKQRALGHALMGELTTQLLIKGRRSVDLLQGILVWLAWYHVHFFTNPQTTNLLQLAVGLVIDLGLKRGARDYGSERLERGVTRSAHGELANSELHTSDERRALLGCFYLSTIVAQWAKRYDSLRYSAQLAGVCRHLEEAQEYPTDQYLVYLVRLQGIVQRIERKVPIDDFTTDTMIPIAMFVKALHGELDNFKKSLPANLADQSTLWLHYYSAEIYLYEISLSSLPGTPQYGDYTYRRLEMLNGCMHAAKAYIDVYYQIPISSLINVPFMHFAQLTSTIIALSKLTRLECPGWDQAYAQEFLDFGGIMMKLSARYEEGRAVAEVPLADNPLFTFFARKLRFIKAWNEAKQKGTADALEAREDSRIKAAKAVETAAANGSAAPAAPVGAAAGGNDGASLNVNIGGEPMQLEHISQDDIFDQLDPSFWQEWATGDMTMWDADAMQQPCTWDFEGLGGGYQ